MRRIALLFYILIICGSLACVPTPTEEYVTNRLDGALERTIRAESIEPYSYSAPKKWQEEMEVRGQKLHIDAKVEISETQTFPVLTLRRSQFDKRKSLQIIQGLLGSNLEIREGENSYEELLYEMHLVQRGYFDEIDEVTGEPVFLPYDDEQERLAVLQSKLVEAPKTETYIPLIDATWNTPIDVCRVRNSIGEYRYVSCYPNQLHIFRDHDSIVQPEAWVLAGDAYPGEVGHPLENITISEEDAITICDNLMKAVGRTDMRIASIQKARSADSFYQELGEGYRLVYVSTISCAIPCYLQEYASCIFLDFATVKEPSYSERWDLESAMIFVTEQGIVDIYWKNPKEIVTIANENTLLMPFDQIQISIRNLIEFGMNGNINNEDVYLNRIVLSSTIQQIPNQGEEAFLVPTWFLFFQTDSTRKHSDMKEYVLLISALDGTYVDLK